MHTAGLLVHALELVHSMVDGKTIVAHFLSKQPSLDQSCINRLQKLSIFVIVEIGTLAYLLVIAHDEQIN